MDFQTADNHGYPIIDTLDGPTFLLPKDMDIDDLCEAVANGVYGAWEELTTRPEYKAVQAGVEDVSKAETYTPTSGMKTAAKRALRWKEEGKATGAGTPVGWGRATDIVAGRGMSLSTVKRMYSFFSRHEVDKQGKDFDNTANPSNGRIMWDAWGGDSGFSWSRGIVERTKDDVAKYAAGQPRNARGQFASTNGPSVIAAGFENWYPHLDGILTSVVEEVGHEGTVAEVFEQYGSKNQTTRVGLNNLSMDEALAETIVQRAGFNTKPTLVDELSPDGTTIYRGVTSLEFVDAYQTDETQYVGRNGLYGRGAYFSDNQELAFKYATQGQNHTSLSFLQSLPERYNDNPRNQGVIVAKFKPDAKIKTFSGSNEHFTYVENTAKEFASGYNNYRKANNLPPINTESWFSNNFSELLVMQGYDGFIVQKVAESTPSNVKVQYSIVLNRGSLEVKK